ncbi:MAG: nucleoside-diphosphate kinase [Candidatus Micrarchaeota archaeon]|nr:nucleoside-diphosphate kinase [Candidatus Micrarchaeota archaeon]
MERTFLMVKPDGVRRGLVGEIISRIERSGLKIVKMKMLTPTGDMVEKHYPSSEEWLRTVGEKTKKSYEELGLDVSQDFDDTDSVAIGKEVKKWLRDYITSGPVVAMVIEGNLAIKNVRRLAGFTLPCDAAPGTIRGDFEIDSPDLANKEHRPVRNIVHASGNPEEAENEIKLWFGDE